MINLSLKLKNKDKELENISELSSIKKQKISAINPKKVHLLPKILVNIKKKNKKMANDIIKNMIFSPN
ncbi:hypothetical protein ACRVX5_16245 [Clostridioides difficile]|nr:hypothetical protein [Clostridioides difficile]MCL6901988.1 hypothetical protein [Clostridioides difficile]MCP3377832.1 hypothetical protein [Clostridioides difficile]MDE3493462.1 hypothetical protein [Clostridioides difficile]MDE3707887.1 hypothetical protein [Clostridioides difficile]